MEVNKNLKRNISDANYFDHLLNWLDEDPLESSKMYQFIHNKLIMYYAARGCAEAEDLADITINRVSQKLVLEKINYKGAKLKYFYGFAKNIHLEYLKKRNLQLNENVNGVYDKKIEDLEEQISEKKKLLRNCLAKMGKKNKGLILKYYNVDSGREKQMRKKIAKEYKMSANSLRVKVFRLKKILTDCLES